MPFDPKKLAEARKKLKSHDIIDRNEPGLEEAPLLFEAPKALEAFGEQAATTMAGKGINPYASAATGIAIQMTPDIIAAIAGLKASPTKEIKSASDILFAPTEQAGKTALGMAEKRVGVDVLPFMADELPTTTKDAIDISHASDYIAKQNPEDLAKVWGSEGINRQRKVYQYILDNYKKELPGSNLSSISKAKDTLTKAIDLAEPSLKGPRENLANTYRRQEILAQLAKYTGLGALAAGGRAIARKFLTTP